MSCYSYHITPTNPLLPVSRPLEDLLSSHNKDDARQLSTRVLNLFNRFRLQPSPQPPLLTDGYPLRLPFSSHRQSPRPRCFGQLWPIHLHSTISGLFLILSCSFLTSHSAKTSDGLDARPSSFEVIRDVCLAASYKGTRKWENLIGGGSGRLSGWVNGVAQ